MTQHFRPDVWKHCVSSNSSTSDHDEQEEIQEEYNESENSDEGAPIAVGEVVYQGRGCARTHDDCMPCGGEVSVGIVSESG